MAFDPFAAIYSQLQAVANYVKTNVEGTLGNAEKSFFDNIFTPVINVLDSGLSDLERGFSNIGNGIANDISGALSDVGSGLETIGADTIRSVSNVINDVTAGFSELASTVTSGITSAFSSLEQGFTFIKNSVEQGLGIVAQDIGSAFDAVGREVVSVFTPILQEIGGFIEQLPSDIATIAKDIVAGVELIPTALEKVGDAILKSASFQGKVDQASIFNTGIGDTVRGLINSILMPTIRELFAAAGFNGGALTGGGVDRIIEVAFAQQAIQEAEEALGASGFIIANLIDRVSDPLLRGAFRELEYAGNETEPNKLLDLDTLLILFHRGAVSADEVRAELVKDGLSGSNADKVIQASLRLNGIGELTQSYFRGLIDSPDNYIIRAKKLGIPEVDIREFLEISRPLIDPIDAIRMWRRGVKVEGDSDSFGDMRRKGFTDARIDAIKAASYELPNVFNIQDFAVRQVDNPDIVNKFDLDYLRDDKYMSGAKALGYTEDDAIRIYRYYWEYPPFFQVARLYQNGRLPEADFKDVLGFLRFTPYWVDRLVADLKPQLTVADIKDLYKYQVISADDIITKLGEIGTPEHLAEQYKELWVASVKLASPLDQTSTTAAILKTQGLSLTLIIQAYKDHVITSAQATELMSEIRIGAEEAGLHLKIADYDLHKVAVDQEIADIKANISAGLLSVHDAIIEMQQLGITATQIDRYSAEFTKMQSRKPKVPTLAEFTSWLKHSIISLGDYVNGLRFLGYDDSWIPYYLAAAGATAADIATVGLTAPTALSQFSNGNTQSNNNTTGGEVGNSSAGSGTSDQSSTESQQATS